MDEHGGGEKGNYTSNHGDFRGIHVKLASGVKNGSSKARSLTRAL